MRGRNEVPRVFTFARGVAVFRTEDNGRYWNGDDRYDNGNGGFYDYSRRNFDGDFYNGGGRDWNRRRGGRIRYSLTLRNIRRVTEAHIHLGRPGENGPVVAYLFGPRRRGVSFFGSRTIYGSLRSRDLVGPLRGSSIRRLIREIERGNAYVNVHTRRYPDGEIRGQIR